MAAFAAAYGILIYLILPARVVALDDDFAYLRSVVLTLQHGRPWTDAWLEPWSAGFSTLAALVYGATGSFYCSTYGLLSALAAVSFYAMCRLLMSRGLSPRRAVVLAFLGLTFPTVLWKSIEFTGVALYVPCLLLALLMAEQRRWVWFLLVWMLALSTRQSALAWAVLPVAAVFEDFAKFGRKLQPSSWLMPSLSAALGVGFYRWLGDFMNKTHAQRVITDQMWAGCNLAQAGKSFLISGIVLLFAVGLGSMVLRCFSDGAPKRKEKPRAIAIGLAMVLGAALFLNARDFIACDHPVFDTRLGGVYLKAVTALAAIGWVVSRFSFRPLALAGAIGAVATLSVRKDLWDYYLIDAAIFGFFVVAPELKSGAAVPQQSHRYGLHYVTSILLAAHLIFIVQFKAHIDRGHALCALGSRALVEGRIPPDEASFLPFGLMAWYFFPYYAQRDGAITADLGDFGRYLKQDTVDIAWRFSKLLRRLPDHNGDLPADRRASIVGGRFKYCWFFSADVLLVHAPLERTRPAKSAYPDSYQLPVFPADDLGWRAVILKISHQPNDNRAAGSHGNIEIQ